MHCIKPHYTALYFTSKLIALHRHRIALHCTTLDSTVLEVFGDRQFIAPAQPWGASYNTVQCSSMHTAMHCTVYCYELRCIANWGGSSHCHIITLSPLGSSSRCHIVTLSPVLQYCGRSSKCHKHHEQRLCKIFWAGVTKNSKHTVFVVNFLFFCLIFAFFIVCKSS